MKLITNNLQKILLPVLVFFGLALSLPANAQLNVITTTGMIADLTKNIGQQHVKVTSLMNSGIDPHLYKATQGDLRRLTRADVILYNGLHLEGKMQDIFDNIARKKPVYAVAEVIDPNKQIQHHQYPDPHVWFDLELWQEVGQEITRILMKQDPNNAESYQANAEDYLNQLKQLNEWVKAEVAQIPAEQRVLITAHDAFGYFGKAYGVKVMGLQGISTAAEFGLQDIKKLKDIIVANNVKAVFVESSVSPRFINSLVKGVNAEGNELTVGGELYSDALGLAGTPQGTYIGMVKHNVNTIVKALK